MAGGGGGGGGRPGPGAAAPGWGEQSRTRVSVAAPNTPERHESPALADTMCVQLPATSLMGTGRSWGTEPAGILTTVANGVLLKTNKELLARAGSWGFLSPNSLCPQMPGGVCGEPPS